MPAEDPPPGVPDWVLTFGDMMSLLLCFFILLFAFSEPKSDKKKDELIESILEKFGSAESLKRFLDKNLPKGGTRPLGRHGKDSGDGDGLAGNKNRVQTMTLVGRTAIGGKFVYTGREGKLSKDDEKNLLDIAKSLQGKALFVEIVVYPDQRENDSDAELNNLSLAFSRAQQTAKLLVTQGKIKRNLVRVVVAADDELSDDDRTLGDQIDTNTVRVFTYERQRMHE